MTSVLIIGQPNVGKTSFVINFAQYLGRERLKLMIKQPAGFIATQTYQLEQAYQQLTSVKPHTTQNIQSIKLKLEVGKQDKEIRLIDSCGLVNKIDPQFRIRQAMARTLDELLISEIILHMIDLNQLSNDNLNKIDKEIYNFLQNKAGYKLLANKLDLDTNNRNLNKLIKLVSKELVIPISALYQEGFSKVKSFLLKNV